MFEKLDVPILGIVENMSFLKMPDGSVMKLFGEGGGLKLAGISGTQLLGSVPMELKVRIGGDEGRPVVVAAPNSEAAIIMKGIAQAVAAAISVKTAE
jgi:ATP-binding protein involved in chromosome partitioning